MKRFHVHVAVRDLQESVRFYAAMFGREPTVLKPDYAKWMLEDPRVNFAISQRGGAAGVNHLGVQAETEEELEGIHANLRQADAAVAAEKGVHCCYANSDKYWVTDPQGVAWESFRSLGAIPLYGDAAAETRGTCGTNERGGCCGPAVDEPQRPTRAGEKTAACCSPPA
jgi:catechol 2,3-dioxygenase-like lactoylglutathione lyase family enzyme